jgi:predicted SAM-dependent methyltransferase
MKRELLIGCGSEHSKRLTIDGSTIFDNPTTLDINPDHNPDLVFDLMQITLPFEDNTFDEIHAYEVLEHTGTQGDYKFFFAQFSEFWRVLKPDGHLFATCPSRHSPWAFGDPSHTRVLQPENLVFLDQDAYKQQVGVTSMSDFRSIYKADFKTVACTENETQFVFIIQAKKETK